MIVFLEIAPDMRSTFYDLYVHQQMEAYLMNNKSKIIKFRFDFIFLKNI